MPTATGHTTAIRASRVIGTTVYNPTGDKIGEVEDVILDKTSDTIKFAVVGFGGILGVGEKYHAVPWASLNYEDSQGGYVVPYSKEQLEAAPQDSIHELTKDDGMRAQTSAVSYYGAL
ncbi:PRC-barrel domain-containing protein [Notoacmeibacter sp. MSK16QG-6]|uniref:PRC-barrel domain-containing protein n=1 Tax=Notoacmeibacter sp. MSK16QG-6 TaxID=2957982 RepID=UPI0020A17094|nr:PRC-barrel domain-containing protein [Notoacmeibacter sp. MSK16QG-6]MCP1200774.1 PRC-barrel domain-containing protein [Notoacmeibacter sp. MSK16QG-6]